jgi:acyl-CoA thioester hydrolase
VSAPSAHRLAVRVYYEDTDAGGVVYHASYLRFAERARTELLRAHGLDHRTLAERAGGHLVVRRCVADFRSPARLDDLLEVETAAARLGGASLTLVQSVRRDGAILARLEVEIAFIGPDGRPRRLPAALRGALGGARSGPARRRAALEPRGPIV